MTPPFKPNLLAAQSRNGQAVWLTKNDRWNNDPREAEILEDEAHATIRLIDGRMLSRQGQSVRLVELGPSADFA